MMNSTTLNAAKSVVRKQLVVVKAPQTPTISRNVSAVARLARNNNHNHLAPLSTTTTTTTTTTTATASSSFLSTSSSLELAAEPTGLYYQCRYLSTTSGNDDKTGQEEATTEAATEPAGEGGEATGDTSTTGEGEAAAKGEEEVEDADPDKKKIADLEEQVTDLKNQLLRSLADQENTRRIAHHDMEKARQLATKGFAKSLLEVWDNLDRALDASKSHEGEGAESISQGIEMTQSILKKAFERNGLKNYGEPGDAFDPQVHHAMSQYKDPSKTPGTIGQVVKCGFTLHNHVLRPADVMVVAKED